MADILSKSEFGDWDPYVAAGPADVDVQRERYRATIEALAEALGTVTAAHPAGIAGILESCGIADKALGRGITERLTALREKGWLE